MNMRGPGRPGSFFCPAGSSPKSPVRGFACEAKGITLAPLDMIIAAHAVAAGALVTQDKAFFLVPEPLRTDDWGTARALGKRVAIALKDAA